MALTWWPKLSKSKSQAASRRRGRKPSRQRFRGLQLEWLEDRLAPATHVWSGAASNLWSNNANWNGGSPSGDASADLVFPSNAQNFANRNDLSSLNIQSISFSGSSYKIDGNGVTLHQGMTVTSAATDSNIFQPNI